MTENFSTPEATARLILEAFYGTTEPTVEDLAAAIAQVERDPAGARILALNEPIPYARADLRLARSRGTYVSSEARPT